MAQPWLLICIFFFSTYPIHLCSSQSFPSQNLEAFYPFFDLSPAPAPAPAIGNLSPQTTPGTPPEAASGASDRGNRRIVKAVAATAATTFVLAMLLFFFVSRYVIARRRKKDGGGSRVNGGGGAAAGGSGGPRQQFVRSGGNVKGLIVDENGLDVVYWKKLEGQSKKNGYQKKIFQSPIEQSVEDEDEESTSRNEIPLLRGKSSTSQFSIPPQNASSVHGGEISLAAAAERPKPIQQQFSPPPARSAPAPPPPPPPPARKFPAPPPPPPPRNPSAPPPPPPPRNPSAPPPPPPLRNPSAPPPPPPVKAAATKNAESSSSGSGGKVKLKPLHWDKVNKNNADHSMVWDRLHSGSFRVDGDLMEALFGTVATNRKSPKSPNSTNPNSHFTSPRSQIVILDPRKSQNVAIVLKSIAISRKELLESLTDGRGMEAELLEKLMRIAPTKEEETQILDFTGDPTRLADAESFLYHLLRSIPSAFTRANAMLFKANYASEVAQLKESLQTLEMGCKELRNRGLFVKLLEAILKAGNRMNAGTSRGNAQAFKLSSLTKLSDVKSSDGKTTLLHFVVEEVVRSEGKRGVLSRDRSLNRTNSNSSNSNSKDDKEKEYIMLGLPVVGGLSAEFTNVKKSAQIDYDSFASTCISISSRAAEVKQCLVQCAVNGEGGEFSKEMKGFLESSEKEMRILRESQKEVIELVKRTTEYYQPGGSSRDQGGHPLQLFVIIRDFLGMVDNVCVEIARSLQKRKRRPSNGSSSPKSPVEAKVPVRFPNLPEHFLKVSSPSSSSESDTEF
ncbi:Formin-like protein 8 [Linum perenne]